MGDEDEGRIERFRPTSGQVTGWLTVVVAGVVVVAGAVYLDDGFPPWVIAAAVLVGVLAWAAILRPALWVEDREVLVMRNMLETVHLRLAAVEELALRQGLARRVADRRWVSAVVGRSCRRTISSRRSPEPAPCAARTVSYPGCVQGRVRRLVDDARDVAGVRPGSAEQLALPDAVRREPAWLPIGVVSLAVLALVVTALL